MSGLTARFDLPLGTAAPRAARHAAVSMLIGWGFDDRAWLDSVELVVGELVANAVRHGGGCLSMDLTAHDGRVVIGAADGSAVVPRRRDPVVGEGGRGLAIIEALTVRWGVENHEGGKRVWVEFARSPGGGSTV